MSSSDKIAQLRALPQELERILTNLSDEQLDTPYREDGWTVRQVVHHLADSHMNAYIRCKLALTEDSPTIKPYLQDAWAELPDGKTAPLKHSLALLCALHERWADVFTTIKEADWQRTIHHPENGLMTLWMMLDAYVAHGETHVGQIRGLRQRMNWI
ncbi:MAG: putative metal-dependent hydrolase [Rhodothermia bacterium]|nr:putative metal-dependent hydrolase [Rhodothermia bacterium]